MDILSCYEAGHLLYTLAININIRPILHGISSHVLHHFGWGWVGVGWIGVGWGGVNTIFTLSLMFFGSVLVNSLRYKYIHTYIHTYVGFELGFDHWGTICALSKNFEGHFYF